MQNDFKQASQKQPEAAEAPQKQTPDRTFNTMRTVLDRVFNSPKS